MNNTKLILHDWDDTITKSFETYLTWYDLFAEHFNLHAPDIEIVKKVWGATVPNIVISVWPEVSLDSAEKMIQEFANTAAFINADFTPPAFEGAREAILKLNDMKIDLGILSSGRRESIKKAYERDIHKEFGKYHKFIVTQHDTPYHKPDARVFDVVKQNLEKLGYTLQDTIYIGDSLVDFEVARNVGIPFIATTSGLDTKDLFMKKGLQEKYILNTFADIPELFKNR